MAVSYCLEINHVQDNAQIFKDEKKMPQLLIYVIATFPGIYVLTMLYE